MREIIVIAHNIRSTHNIGSIFRTSEGFGIKEIILSGYSPYPELPSGDPRLPHERIKLTSQIAKTALGAEKLVPFTHSDDIFNTIRRLKSHLYTIIALEQAPNSLKMQNLSEHHLPNKIALLLGEEVHGIPPDLLSLTDVTIEIPMLGQKESFNVSVATGIALYELAIK